MKELQEIKAFDLFVKALEVEKPPFFMEHGGKQVIHVNFNSAEVDEVYFPQLELVGDIATSFTRLTQRLEPVASHDFSYFKRVLIDELAEKICLI